MVIERRIHAHTKRYQAKGHGTLDMRFNCTVKCAREWVHACVFVCVCVWGLLQHRILHIIISRSLTLIDQHQHSSGILPCPALPNPSRGNRQSQRKLKPLTPGCCWAGCLAAWLDTRCLGWEDLVLNSGCGGAVSKCRWLLLQAHGMF